MSPHRLIAERLETSFRWIGFGLAGEMAVRSVAVFAASPGRDTVFQLVAGWSLPFTLVGSVLIFIGHLFQSELRRRYAAAMIGHALGFTWAFAFGAALVVGWVLAILDHREATGLILAPVFLLLAALHGAYIYSSARGLKWIHKSSAS